MFIVVLSTLVVNTIIEKGPLIFMTLAQQKSGEIDNVYFIKGDEHNSNNQWNDLYSMNYTRAVEVLDENGVDHYISPRY